MTAPFVIFSRAIRARCMPSDGFMISKSHNSISRKSSNQWLVWAQQEAEGEGSGVRPSFFCFYTARTQSGR